MSGSAAPDPADTPRPARGLPPVPLTDEQLAPLADQDTVEAVYVPDGRPASVVTRAGEHRGDILEFYIETDGKYVKFGYTMGGGGLAWKRYAPTAKTETGLSVLAVRRDLENYRRLER